MPFIIYMYVQYLLEMFVENSYMWMQIKTESYYLIILCFVYIYYCFIH